MTMTINRPVRRGLLLLGLVALVVSLMAVAGFSGGPASTLAAPGDNGGSGVAGDDPPIAVDAGWSATSSTPPAFFFAGAGSFNDEGPFTFDSGSQRVNVSVTDDFLCGDEFRVYDFGVAIGDTSAVLEDAGCPELGPDAAFADPDYSSGTFNLGPGAHSITIQAIVSPFGAGRGYIRVDTKSTEITKAPRLANLWLCTEGPCDNKAGGVEGVNLSVNLNNEVGGPDPKCTGFPNFLPPEECDTQQIGSFEFEVRFDAKYVTVEIERGQIFTTGACTDGFAGSAGCPPLNVDCFTATGEGFIQFSCVTKGKPFDAAIGPGQLAIVHVRPTADVYKLLIPNQENGIVTELINQDCQLSDLQGHPIKVDICENAAITIRYLEGDVHSDCVIDSLDQQQIAFRWGAQLGHLLYNARYDLEPSFPKADGDIDAKDLQFVFGRHVGDPTSTCKDPHPPQPPVDPQVKVGPPVTPE